MESRKTVVLEPSVWQQVADRADADGVTPDEVVNEALRIGLEESRWRRLLAKGQRYGQASGYAEADVARVIQEFREEQRGR
jgi:hypothetical protein